MGTEDCAVEREEPEGTRRCLAGVENPDTREPRETSGWVPLDAEERSGWVASAADIVMVGGEGC